MSLGISVVITMFNNCEQVNSALASINISYEYLSPEEKKSFEVIIVDDSPFYSAQIDQHFSFPIIIEKLKENVGTGGARNKGFHMAHFDWVLSLDSDICFRVETLSKFFSWIKRERTFDIVQSIVSDQPVGKDTSFFQHYLAISFYVDAITDNEIHDQPKLFNTMCFLAHRQTFLDIGGFSSKFKSSGGEEFEITKRFSNTRIVQDNEIRVDHYYERFIQRMRKLFRRSANYQEVVVQNDAFPKYFKLVGYARAFATLTLTLSIGCSFLYPTLALPLILISILVLIFCDGGRRFRYAFNRTGLFRTIMFIPCIMSEFLIVMAGGIVSKIRND